MRTAHRSRPPRAAACGPSHSQGRRNQLRHLGDQLTALEALRAELRQLAVRLMVEEVTLNDLQRAADAGPALAATSDDRSSLATASCAGSVSGAGGRAGSSGTGAATAAASVWTAGTGASSSAFWDDARSVGTTALTSATTRSSLVDTDSEVEDMDDDVEPGWEDGNDPEQQQQQHRDTVAYVSAMMDADAADSSVGVSDSDNGDSVGDF